ncbi:histidine kinase dimerization/phosphoacceptor domain -containing protein [Chitinophaga sp. S165]|uniref:histidine kinase dimerization/phosphoacceptor domain -containing protein n=1 Tax=Chitinophaga sp. S165 TaxID=2135462 RepID=UPI000D717334|nr:histidine kinase dimerization/phosphoacceptor domain -containing protein [Chitinophaga sp. S165]PWV45414.1 two-component sensor histidine kinase [Chitinophaga sp. S165]
MNRPLLLCCCIIGYLLPCLAQKQLPSYGVLKQLINKERPDTAEMHILLDAGYTYVLRPGTARSDMDSATLLAEKVLTSSLRSKDKIWEGQSCLLYSQIFREQNILMKGKAYAIRARDIFEKYRKKDYLADTYIELANYYGQRAPEDIDIRISYYKDAIKLYKEAGLKEQQAHTLYVLGDHYNVIDDYKSLTEALEQSVALYDEIKIDPGADVYSLLGTGYNLLGDFGNALKYSLLAVKSIELVKDITSTHATVYNRLGILYYYMGEHQDALKYYHKAWQVSLKLNDTPTLRTLAFNIGNSYAKMKMPEKALAVMRDVEHSYPTTDSTEKIWVYIFIAGCHLDLKQHLAALPYIRRAQKGRDQLPEILQVTLDDVEARYYLQNGEYMKSYQLALNVIAAGIKMKNLNLQSNAYLALFRADSAMGNYKEAVEQFRNYKIVNDSIFQISRLRQISTLQVQFETQQKQQSIELLTRTSQLQEAALDKAHLTRNVIIAGAAMLAIMLTLVYNRYKLKLRSNRKLEHKQEEINQKNHSLEHLITTQNKLLVEKEWLVKEIHHRVKNNLQIVMSLLNTQAAFLDDKDALNAIRESRYRMQAISLIHQKLYQSENMALIDMHTYILDLVEYLKDGFSDVSKTRFELQISHVKLDVSQSVPIGLILNEAITNAIKYAFKPDGNAIITISLQETSPGQLTLTIADNGVGLPPEDDHQPRKISMGMMLMNTLAEQLDGTLNIRNRNGVVITVTFKYHEQQTFPVPEELAAVPDYVLTKRAASLRPFLLIIYILHSVARAAADWPLPHLPV